MNKKTYVSAPNNRIAEQWAKDQGIDRRHFVFVSRPDQLYGLRGITLHVLGSDYFKPYEGLDGILEAAKRNGHAIKLH